MEEVYCEFKYSGVAAAFLATASLATLAILALVPFPAETRALLMVAVLALAAHAHRWLRRVRALKVDETRAVWVQDRSGLWRSGSVSDGSLVAPWLTILNWRPPGARFDRTVVILPDMLPADAMRRIRVILRWA